MPRLTVESVSTGTEEAEDDADITLLDPPHVASLKLRMREAIYHPHSARA